MKTTGGSWDPADWPTYFLASNMACLRAVADLTTHKLLAVNELRAASDLAEVDRFIASGSRVLIDSGVFSLAAEHGRKHDMPVTEAIALDPDQVDGFGELLESYLRVVRRFGARSWGYIEIDQGGRENKIKTRAKLEALGLAPIPVYHPFADGWDYFDHLAENYDRISMGNLVGADPATRKRLMATAWERRRKHPHVWIHMLGLTPNERSLAYPLPSCDSSTWLSGARWGQHNAMVANKRCWSTGDGLLYDLNEEGSTAARAWRLGAYDSEMMRRTMVSAAREAREVLGCDFTGGATSEGHL